MNAVTAAASTRRSTSTRDPAQGINLALLTCRAFANPKPIDQQTWHIRLPHRLPWATLSVDNSQQRMPALS
jgi:hypothetical protein